MGATAPIFFCACGCGERVTFDGYTKPDGANETPVAYVDALHRARYLSRIVEGAAK